MYLGDGDEGEGADVMSWLLNYYVVRKRRLSAGKMMVEGVGGEERGGDGKIWTRGYFRGGRTMDY
jgi:hypothetical protein